MQKNSLSFIIYLLSFSFFHFLLAVKTEVDFISCLTYMKLIWDIHSHGPDWWPLARLSWAYKAGDLYPIGLIWLHHLLEVS